MRRLVLAFAIALAVVGGASAEVVARGVQNGMLALGPKGTPFVAYVRGSGLLIATRASKGRWRATRADSVSAGSQVMAFTVGVTGPVALVQSADDRTLVLVRRRAVGWQTTRLAGALPAEVSLGWPGLVLDRHGLLGRCVHPLAQFDPEQPARARTRRCPRPHQLAADHA